MNVMIEGHEGSVVQATAGNKTGVVALYSTGVNVLCCNAAHRAWRGGGRFFPTWEDARDGYRSPEMRAIIDASRDLLERGAA